MTHYLPLGALRQWAAAILHRCGLAADDAQTSAELILRADARGLPTHGITRLPSYVDKLQSGEFNPRPGMRVTEAPGVVTIDADGAMGQVAAQRILEHGLGMLERHASVVCRVRDCGHLGAVGLYALAAAEAGAVCIAAQRTPPLIALPGHAGPVIGNNPLAFAAPVAGDSPLLVDMASSVAARGHILLRARTNDPIPAGWALDAQGDPTTDAHAALGGALIPSGGHKGLALSMLVELLAGALCASADSLQRVASELPVGRLGAVGGQSAFLLLFNPQRIAGCAEPTAQPDLVAEYLRVWTAAYLQRGGPSARLPGRRGADLERAAIATGVAISMPLMTELRKLARQFEVPVPPTQSTPHREEAGLER